MASRLTLRHPYPASPERVREVLTDRRYLQAKLQAVGGPRAELVSWEQDARGVTFVLHQAVPEDSVPPFLRSMLSEGLTIRRTETWSSAGGSVHAVVDGAPGTIIGMMRFAPDPAGCVLNAELTAEVPLPLVGAKVEKIITSNVAALMEKEYQFTLAWLDNPAQT
jgi:S1-C subfamily serine protease